ncbi:MAG: hypothetical protein EHM80_14320 [Nitrospiraceae bacterium]|nr:MAG: hypothetical protein EHM80_14320 [Nitrospiraceae bacterium]
MGSIAAIGTLVSQGKARQPDQHRVGENRLYANLGPLATIIGGPSGRMQTTAKTSLWFRDRQFLFTSSPF